MLTKTEISLIAERVAEIVLDKNDELLTAKSCSEWLNISIGALHKRCEKGKIPCYRRHGALYFSKKEVSAYYMQNDKPAS
ncbi:helix-turn-helix domain-containing protein [Bacteroides neonati]|uniref:helix-turn-helix domain-containing protein n=1 Tax=Bacteroides neonati TaxID=1347393 RepID=UPI0004B91365|nr:helix-turn-helix domain-containing protein [Bacteroides neonati]